MTVEEIIQAVLSKRSEVTRSQILEALEAEKCKTGGLMEDETLMRLIAARYEVQVPQDRVFNHSLSIGILVPNLNDVTLVGRIVAVFPVKTFEGKTSGKYASLMITDKDGLIRVMIWNDKTSLIESGALKAGQVARFRHGYTREDRIGKVELHIGGKTEVEINPEDVDERHYPSIGKFVTKTGEINTAQQGIHLEGSVEEVSPLSTFTRQDASPGKVLRFVLADSSGKVTVVAWNEKAEELEPLLKRGLEVRLVNAKTKAGSSGGFEVHVDSVTFVDFCGAP